MRGAPRRFDSARAVVSPHEAQWGCKPLRAQTQACLWTRGALLWPCDVCTLVRGLVSSRRRRPGIDHSRDSRPPAQPCSCPPASSSRPKETGALIVDHALIATSKSYRNLQVSRRSSRARAAQPQVCCVPHNHVPNSRVGLVRGSAKNTKIWAVVPGAHTACAAHGQGTRQIASSLTTA